MGRCGYPPEFRRRVLDLVEAGRKIAEVADDRGISDQTIYSWRRQDWGGSYASACVYICDAFPTFDVDQVGV